MSETRQVVCGILRADQPPAGRARAARCALRLLSSADLYRTSPRGRRERLRTSGREQRYSLLVDVWAPWCGPCRAMAPMFERSAQRLEPRVRLLKLNSDAAPALSSRLGISGIPTLLLMRGGREIARRRVRRTGSSGVRIMQLSCRLGRHSLVNVLLLGCVHAH